jgi:hypothetical protein
VRFGIFYVGLASDPLEKEREKKISFCHAAMYLNGLP